ncbi:MAG: ATP-dependent Clp protease ATP-binding subunit [Oscillospiraceae bacterium]|jgi:ATP-dependent Clp protease ATP-binding subunit ClpA|nr:ATP-dependent Clp protease ATP-binding subunit [Oscillospiraceae bacterium]
MHPQLCSRCKKNAAVIFITKIENGRSTNEGICLKCARELNIKPVEDMIRRMGLTDEEIETASEEMLAMTGLDEYPEPGSDEDSRTTTFPFLDRMFGGPVEQFPRGGDFPSRQPGRDRESGGPGGKKRKYLENYCMSLTQRARDGKLDKMVGRKLETERVVQILNRRQKNNPCLIGEPGVGKTAIAEGLAQCIVDGGVPFKLADKEVYLLDLTALVAGTQFRGQFESRMKGLVEEVKACGNVILVIDEVHSIVGAGDADGSMNAANILKPALARGEIQVIGATTFSEYRRFIERDAALERRFQPVAVSEPSIADAVEIMRGVKHYYEEYHEVDIPDEIARQAVVLAERYITDRYLPDKAIDLLDEACSDLNLRSATITRMGQIRKERSDLSSERERLLASPSGNDFARLAAIRSRDIQISDELCTLESDGLPVLGLDNLARVIEMWTKIPASSIREDEYKRLSELDKRLKAHIVGQDDAVETVCAAIRRSRVGIAAKHKPVSFIFIGSTGVGKTELVKRLAEDLFDTPESLVRLDMSEFMERHTVSRIIGSPPGYVGYDEAGQLTEKIRRKPYSVILFDEIEKAHPDVLNIMLQILDDGRLTDSHGRTVNFENTVIIMTTNAGSDRKENALGFNRTKDEQGKEKAAKALRDFLRPEFINRVDEIVYFNKLVMDDFRKIAGLMLNELGGSMAEKGIELRYDDSLLDLVADKSFSDTYGARNLRRTIQKEVEDIVARELISSYTRKVKQIGLTVKDGEILIIAV